MGLGGEASLAKSDVHFARQSPYKIEDTRHRSYVSKFPVVFKNVLLSKILVYVAHELLFLLFPAPLHVVHYCFQQILFSDSPCDGILGL